MFKVETQQRTHAGIDPARWAAVASRDAGADGSFYYGVRTTGVYCRPSCPSRRARPENVEFFDSVAQALAAGYRPCKRCTPGAASTAERQAARIAALCRLIERARTPPSLQQLAAHAHLSPFHLQRLFKSVTGLTPRAYAQAVRAGRVRQLLPDADSVTAAALDAGFESGSRFYASSQARLGMTPRNFRARGRSERIRYALGHSSLGEVLVAHSGKGICAISLGDDAAALVRALRKRFAHAQIEAGGAQFDRLLRKVLALIEQPHRGRHLPLDIRGTVFQERVWDALRAIPPGSTASYGEIAQRIGAPGASRAVAQACGANPVAVAIPCHRVVRGDGGLSGYRWGVARKRALLARESAAPAARAPSRSGG